MPRLPAALLLALLAALAVAPDASALPTVRAGAIGQGIVAATDRDGDGHFEAIEVLNEVRVTQMRITDQNGQTWLVDCYELDHDRGCEVLVYYRAGGQVAFAYVDWNNDGDTSDPGEFLP